MHRTNQREKRRESLLWRRSLSSDPQHRSAVRSYSGCMKKIASASRDTPGEIRRDVRGEIREFLTTRRARITPEQAGLPAYGGERRRVPGLRRDEVALLAGISPSTTPGSSAATRPASRIASSTASLTHCSSTRPSGPICVDLFRAAGTTRAPGAAASPERVRPTVQRVLDSMIGTPAFVLSGAPGHPGRQPARGTRLFSPVYADPVQAGQQRPVRLPRPAAPPSSSATGTSVANDTVAMLRAEAGRHPYDRRLSDLIGELSTRSDEFRGRWAAHDVRIHTTGVKLLHHPVVGDLDLPFESFPVWRPSSARASSPTPPSPGHPPRTPSTCWPAGPRAPTFLRGNLTDPMAPQTYAQMQVIGQAVEATRGHDDAGTGGALNRPGIGGGSRGRGLRAGSGGRQSAGAGGGSGDAEDRFDRGARLGVGGRLVDLVEVVEGDQPVEREPALHVKVEQLGDEHVGDAVPSTTPMIVLQLCMKVLAAMSRVASGSIGPHSEIHAAGFCLSFLSSGITY